MLLYFYQYYNYVIIILSPQRKSVKSILPEFFMCVKVLELCVKMLELCVRVLELCVKVLELCVEVR